MDNDTGKML